MKKSLSNRLLSLATVTTMLFGQTLNALGAEVSDLSSEASSEASSEISSEFSSESSSEASFDEEEIIIFDDTDENESQNSSESASEDNSSEDASDEASSLGSSLEDEEKEPPEEEDKTLEELPDDYYTVFPTNPRSFDEPKVESSLSGATLRRFSSNAYDISKNSSLPSYYVTSNLPALRSQSPYGTCWAFSSTALAEISIMQNYAGYAADFSELHLAYFSYNTVVDPLGGTSGDYFTNGANTSTLNMGGNVAAAMNTFARWVGVADESTARYTEDAKKAVKTGLDPDIAYTGVARVKNFYYDLVDTDVSSISANKHRNIKQLVYKYGAATISYAALNSISAAVNSNLYNQEHNAYYNPTFSKHNHSVTIVGWDDNFPKENFAKEAPGDGAFLIRNSWKEGDGTSVEDNYGYTGYFWMSYYEATLGTTSVAAEFELAGAYDNNYEYDGGYYNVTTTDSKVANVFTAHASGADMGEYIEAVSFETGYSNLNYVVDVYTDLEDANDPESGTLATTIEGSTVYSGFYTLQLPERVPVSQGDTFSVVVTLSKAGSTCGVSEEFQYNSDPAGVSAAEGQSFKYNYSKKAWEDAVTANNDKNYAVKAYTTNASEPVEGGSTIIVLPESIEVSGLDNDSLTIGLKEEYTLDAKVLPEDATNKNLVWTSSDESIATVSSTGEITGVSIGTATITVSVEDTDIAKDITVTVVDITSIEMYRLLDGQITGVPSQTRRIDPLTLTAVVSTWNNQEYDTDIKWSAKVSPSNCATYETDENGNLVITPVSKGTVKVQATSVQNPTFSVTRTIALKPYTVSYVLGDGIQNPDNPTFYFIGETKTLSEPTIEKENYYFDGWYTDSNFTESSARTSILPTDAKDLTFYAKFEMTAAVIPPVREEVPELHVTGPDNVESDSYELAASENLQLTALFVDSKSITPVTEDLTWVIKQSSVKGVASIDSKGLITASKEGWVKVVAKAATDKSSTGYVESNPIKISVYVPMQSAELNKDAVTMAPGASFTLEALLTPTVLGANSDNTVTGSDIGSDVRNSIRWKLLNEADEGYLQFWDNSSNNYTADGTAVGAFVGKSLTLRVDPTLSITKDVVVPVTAIITPYKATEPTVLTCNVTISAGKISRLSLSPSKLNLDRGADADVSAKLTPEIPVNSELTWEIADDGSRDLICFVDPATGESVSSFAMVTKDDNGSGTNTVKIRAIPNDSQTEKTVATVIVSTTGTDANGKFFTNSGKVKTAKLTVNIGNQAKDIMINYGKTNITWNDADKNNVVNDGKLLKLYTGKTTNLKAKIFTGYGSSVAADTIASKQPASWIFPEDSVRAGNQKVVWTSSNPAVATVNANGSVKAVGTGMATISVSTVDQTYDGDGSFANATAKAIVYVYDQATSIAFDKTAANLCLEGDVSESTPGQYEAVTATVDPDSVFDNAGVTYSGIGEADTKAVEEKNVITWTVNAGTMDKPLIAVTAADTKRLGAAKNEAGRQNILSSLEGEYVGIAKAGTGDASDEVVTTFTTTRGQSLAIKALHPGTVKITAVAPGGKKTTCVLKIYTRPSDIDLKLGWQEGSGDEPGSYSKPITKMVTINKVKTEKVILEKVPFDSELDYDFTSYMNLKSVKSITLKPILDYYAGPETEDVARYSDRRNTELEILYTNLYNSTKKFALDKTVTFSSSDENIVYVNAKGVMTAVSAGTALIKITSADGGKEKTIHVTVE